MMQSSSAKIEVAQPHRRPLVERQPRQGGAHRTDPRCTGGGFGGHVDFIDNMHRIRDVEGGLRSALATDAHQCLVHGDSVHPRPHRGFTAERSRVAPHADERVLGDLENILRVVEDPTDDRDDSSFVVADEFREGSFVPVVDLLQEQSGRG